MFIKIYRFVSKWFKNKLFFEVNVLSFFSWIVEKYFYYFKGLYLKKNYVISIGSI